MQIKLANFEQSKEIIQFFDTHLNKENNEKFPYEFFCPFGLKSAIKREQVLIAIDNEKIISALRFYPRKGDGIVSIYQFAIDPEWRGKNLLKEMLKSIHYKEFEFICPKNIGLNSYYGELGANIWKQDTQYNYRRLTF